MTRVMRWTVGFHSFVTKWSDLETKADMQNLQTWLAHAGVQSFGNIQLLQHKK